MAKKLCWASIVLTLVFGSGHLLYAQDPNPNPSPTEPEAMPILKKMAEFLAKATNFSVNIREGYDVVQASGQKIEFGATRKLIVNRPDHLRIEVAKSDGENDVVIFDGKEISIYNARDNVYATAVKEGTLDDAIKYAVADLGLRVPLAVMFLTTLPDELKSRVDFVDYVETANIAGAECDHLAARTLKGVDFQIWIPQSGEPLPKRIVITYSDEKGQPQFWADLTDWNLLPEVSASNFTFTPPKGAERIEFLAQIPEIATKNKNNARKGANK